MNGVRQEKVTTSHLEREVYLYVRHAVVCVEDSQRLQQQYWLKQQAEALGWSAKRVVVIDSDLGESGTSTGRVGFEEVLKQVTLRRVGLVMALEPSRWTRHLRDWHRLMDACAATNTLLLDQDGLYDLNDSDDRLLLGCDVLMPKSVSSSLQQEEVLA